MIWGAVRMVVWVNQGAECEFGLSHPPQELAHGWQLNLCRRVGGESDLGGHELNQRVLSEHRLDRCLLIA